METNNSNPKESKYEFLKNFLIGGIAAVLAKTSMAPIDRVKTILQCQDANRQVEIDASKKYKGIIDCFKRIPKEQGFTSFWRGNFVNCIRYFPAQALNFAFKDLFEKYNTIADKNKLRYFACNLLCGGAAGGASLTIVYPIDFCKTRLATDIGKAAQDREFNGLNNCIQKILKTDGLIGFYRGFCISVTRMIIYRSIYFGVYDSIKHWAFKDYHNANTFYLFLLAQFSTNLSSFLSYPLDTIRKRLMMMSGRKTKYYTNSIGCLRHILKNEGTSGLYKGALSNIFKGMGGALILVFYDKRQLLFR